MLPEKPFYLIRHGESEANAARITAGGKYDSPLTAKGRGQAAQLAPFMEHLAIKPGNLYHSTMIRARDTAKILNEFTKLDMTALYDLREVEVGEWDGRPWHEIEPLMEDGLPPPGGESESVFAQRIQATLADILTLEKTPPLIVAHGGLFHALGYMYEYGMSEVQNCHLHYFEPYPETKAFPWRIFQFDVIGAVLERRPAPFCLSQALSYIA